MRYIAGGIILLAILFGATACKNEAASQRHQAYNQRVNTFQKALDQVPTPNVSNFPRRKTLAEAVVRQSLPNHPWYVYLLGMNGNTIGYYVAKSVPVNDCDYLSNTVSDAGFEAPSLEGIYQSGSGCNTLTFFDLTTNAEIQITGLNTYVTDSPLKVDAKPIRVKSSR